MPRAKAPAMEREARRVKVAELLLARKTYRQIADELGVSLGTVNADAVAIEKEWKERQCRDRETLVAYELEELNRLQAGLRTRARRGSIPAVALTLKVMERRAKFLGLDAPARQDVNVNVRDLDAAIERELAHLAARGEGEAAGEAPDPADDDE